MIHSDNSLSCDPSRVAPSMPTPSASQKTIALLEELLIQSIGLRAQYKCARWQAVDPQFHRLRLLFDSHYKEQLALVDVIVDRLRMLGGSHCVLAGDFLCDSQLSGTLRGRTSVVQLLSALLDAHDMVLSAAAVGTCPLNDVDARHAAVDFVVGQVVLTNNTQSFAIRERLVGCDARQRFVRISLGVVDACE
jgi:starvation-inducible DNA-binding protein